jgi:radical SAM superfamily enzyme YgiQ (UPF0313 family)
VRLLLVNPSNPLVNIVRREGLGLNRYRIWQPLGLMTLAGLTPAEWEVTILDENVGRRHDEPMPRPDLVGITAFTSQAPRAYEVAWHFRNQGVPVVMGGIHATMCVDEVLPRVDAVVTGEADAIWPQVLADTIAGRLRPRYDGGLADMTAIRPARHDLLTGGYAFGAVQTTRGCPMNCSFCSVTAFNGTRYRQRPVDEVVREMAAIPERRVLVVDDNLIGTRVEHIARAKALFRALAAAKLGKRWVAQATINFADDEELLSLAAESGCVGVFVGFESPTPEGLNEIGKRFNLAHGRDLPASVRRIQRHGILVVGSFILGLDVDTAGIGRRIADAAIAYGVDNLNALFLTPLPGTKLWRQLDAERRIPIDRWPADWQYYTLTYPVAKYAALTREEAIAEMLTCNGRFYAPLRMASRFLRSLWLGHQPLINLFGGLASRQNAKRSRTGYANFNATCLAREVAEGLQDPRPQSWPALGPVPNADRL